MNIRRKAGLIKLIGLAGMLIGLFYVSSTVVLLGFAEAEKEATKQNVHRFIRTLHQQYNKVIEESKDWGCYDPTYRYVKDRNPDYIHENFTVNHFQNLKINMIALLDTSGNIVICRIVDNKKNGWESIPKDLPNIFKKIASTRTADGKFMRLHGIVMTSICPVMISSEQILTTDEKGPSRGTIVVGQFLDNKRMDQLSKLTQISSVLFDLRKHSEDSVILEKLVKEKRDEVRIVSAKKNYIFGYEIINDVWGKPVVALKTTSYRQIYMQGKKSVHNLLYYLLVLGLAAGAIELFMTEKIVSVRLARLSKDVINIGKNGDHSSRLQVSGNDELSQVAISVNEMLEILETSQDYLRENENKLKSILNSVYVGVLIVDPVKHIIVDANATALQMIGASEEDIIGRVCHQCVCPAQVNKCPITDLNQSVDKSERILLRMDGSSIPILKTVVNTTINGQPRLVESFVDISERKKAEEALKRAHDELEIRVEERTEELANANAALINEITERKQVASALYTRLRYEEGLASCSQTLLGIGDMKELLRSAVDKLLNITEASRVYLFESFDDPVDGLCMRQVIESCIGNVEAQIDNPILQHIPYNGAFERWRDELYAGHLIQGLVSDFPLQEQQILIDQDIKSLLVLPVRVGGIMYGFIGFDDCENYRIWQKDDIRLLKTAADMIGSYIERKRVEEEIRHTNREKERLLSSITLALIVCDTNGIVRKWNAAAEDILGIAASDAVGKSIDQLEFKWEDSEMMEEILRAITSGESANLGHISVVCPDGRCVTLMVTTTPILDDEGKTWECLVVGSDVTELKALEVQLHHAQKLESIGQLAAGIAHEMNTPIQYVGDNTRFLQDSLGSVLDVLNARNRALQKAKDGNLDSETLKELERIENEADIEYLAEEIPKATEQSLDGINRVAKIVRAMKQFSHPGTNEHSEEDINKAIESTVTISRNEWKYVSELVCDLDRNLPLVPCMIADLNQVVLNLIVNASHAIADACEQKGTQEKGLITVSTRRDGDWVEIRVSDTGTGIPEHAQQRVFEPFFTTKRVGMGTGQGLAMARSIVTNMHNGTITFDTKEGEGTAFIIRIPLLRQAA